MRHTRVFVHLIRRRLLTPAKLTRKKNRTRRETHGQGQTQVIFTFAASHHHHQQEQPPPATTGDDQETRLHISERLRPIQLRVNAATTTATFARTNVALYNTNLLASSANPTSKQAPTTTTDGLTTKQGRGTAVRREPGCRPCQFKSHKQIPIGQKVRPLAGTIIPAHTVLS